MTKQDKKIASLEAQLSQYTEQKDKSPEGESIKEAARILLSLLVGMAVTYAYQKYPVLGTLQPDQSLMITGIVALLARMIDKFFYQMQKNQGTIFKSAGFDWVLQSVGNIFVRKNIT